MVVPCCCGPSSCTTTIAGKIAGCNSLGFPSMTVEAHDSTAGGTLLASTTTNSTGNYTFSGITATSGNDIVIVPAAATRFVAVNRTLNWTSGASPSATQWGCGKTTPTATTTQTVATGYHCWPGCLYPVADTLHLTDSFFGSFTVTNSGSGWVFPTISYSYPGSGPCAAKTVTVSGSSAMQWQWKCGFGPNFCPDDAAASSCNTVFTGTTTCFVPSVSAFSISGTWPSWGTQCVASLVIVGPISETVTLTE